MTYSDDLEAKAKAATARPWKHVGRKGLDLNHIIVEEKQTPMVANFGDAIYHDSPDADLTADLANHVEDFVRLLRAAEEIRLRATIMSTPDPDCGEEVLRMVFADLASIARDTLAAFEVTK